MRGTRKKPRLLGGKLIKCRCRKRVRIRNPIAVGLEKTHAVCKRCNRAYHWSLDRGIYSHIWKEGGVDVHFKH